MELTKIGLSDYNMDRKTGWISRERGFRASFSADNHRLIRQEETKMRTRMFCGKETSVIALGTMAFGGAMDEGFSFELMDRFTEMGGNFLDTARIYGDFANRIQGGSEKVIGKWMEARRNRDRIVLGTKGAHPDVDHMHTGRCSAGEIASDMAQSLENLRTDCLDIYYLHRDDESRSVQEILETLTSLVENHQTRYVGLSNWRTERIEEAFEVARTHNLVVPYANQPQFSLARQVLVEDDTLVQMDADMYNMHKKHQMPCVAFSSQAKGFLTKLDALGEEGIPDKARRRFLCPENTAVLERARTLSGETGYSVHALAVAYLTSQPFPVFPICGVSSFQQLDALREAADAELTAEQVEYLRPFPAKA